MTKKESKKLKVGDKIMLQRKSNGSIYALGIILSIEKPEDYINQAFDKRTHTIATKTKVKP